MQIYTKILIGMAVGAVVGLTLGPNSSFLAHDRYKVGDAASAEVYLDREKPDTRLKLPSGTGLDFTQLELIEGEVSDSTGAQHTVPTWVKVEFRISERLALRDEGEVLRKQVNKRTGERVTAWLKLQQVPIDGGGIRAIDADGTDLGSHQAFWFAWSQFHPKTALWPR